MGLQGVANPTFSFLNLGNPALLPFNNIYTFELAGFFESRALAQGDARESHTNGNFHHLAMALPMKRNRWTMSLGVNPLSTVNHQIRNTSQLEGSTVFFVNDLSYSGGINEAFVANGVRIGKYLAIGGKASYLFGSRNESNETYLVDAQITLADITTLYQRQQTYSDLAFQGSAALLFPLKNDKTITLGGTYNFETNVNTSNFSKLEQFRNADLRIISSDTILNEAGGFATLPAQVTLGASISQQNKYLISAEYRFADWSLYRTASLQEATLTNRTSLAIGGEWTPQYNAINNYLLIMTYRFGLSYENTPFIVNGNQIDEIGINFGLTAPLRYNSVNVGLRVGNRGSLSDNLVRENFFRISLGITIGDESWFYRSRFN